MEKHIKITEKDGVTRTVTFSDKRPTAEDLMTIAAKRYIQEVRSGEPADPSPFFTREIAKAVTHATTPISRTKAVL